MMGFGSLLVALVPSYASIGIGAPVIVLVARLLQGFSTGAEFQSSAVHLVEHAWAERRAFVGSSQLASIGFAILLGTGTAPLIAAWFIRIGQPIAVSWYVMAIGLVTFIAFCTMPETRGRTLG